MSYKLKLKYLYTYYCFDEIFDTDVIEEEIEIGENEQRFVLHLQEDSSFVLSPLQENGMGKFVVLTYPNKDNLVIRLSESEEILYDEFFESMGNNNHNVYEGTATLVFE